MEASHLAKFIVFESERDCCCTWPLDAEASEYARERKEVQATASVDDETLADSFDDALQSLRPFLAQSVDHFAVVRHPGRFDVRNCAEITAAREASFKIYVIATAASTFAQEDLVPNQTSLLS